MNAINLQTIVNNCKTIPLLVSTLPNVKNCGQCLLSQPNWKEGGHCYMFKEEPTGPRCGQFVNKDQ